MPTPASSPRLVTEVPRLPPRPPDANKGTFGRVAAAAGSRGMSGAAVLCASAALRGGAGLVQLAVPSGIQPVVAAANPCYLTAGLPEDGDGRFAAGAEGELVRLVRESTAAALGPGIGRGPALAGLLRAALQTDTPVVLDADGLNAFAAHPESLRRPGAPLVLTPHPGEFARLLGVDIPAVQADRQGSAARFAAEHGAVVLLKGHRTVITDGERVAVNTTGNPGMATGGTGDVLTGLIAALLAQGLAAFEAAQLGAYLHGLAGDLARDDLTEASLIASDLLDYLPRAFRAQAGRGSAA
jgi:NAD(P)H-hydrate epimerase